MNCEATFYQIFYRNPMAFGSEASAVVANARRKLAREGRDASARLGSLVGDLETLLSRTARVVDQTRTRLSGTTPDGATRLGGHMPDPLSCARRYGMGFFRSK